MNRGVGLFPTADIGTMRQLTKQAEDLGYANVWYGDSPNIWREGYVTMAACARGAGANPAKTTHTPRRRSTRRLIRAIAARCAGSA